MRKKEGKSVVGDGNPMLVSVTIITARMKVYIFKYRKQTRISKCIKCISSQSDGVAKLEIIITNVTAHTHTYIFN